MPNSSDAPFLFTACLILCRPSCRRLVAVPVHKRWAAAPLSDSLTKDSTIIFWHLGDWQGPLLFPKPISPRLPGDFFSYTPERKHLAEWWPLATRIPARNNKHHALKLPLDVLGLVWWALFDIQGCLELPLKKNQSILKIKVSFWKLLLRFLWGRGEP